MAVERVLSNLNLISFKTEEGLQNHIDELQDGDLVFTPDNSLKTNQISNCITEIPQDIKLELANGVLTLKAGSKVYVPNGAGVFDIITTQSDIVWSEITQLTDKCLIFFVENQLTIAPISICYSGTNPSGITGNYYNTTANTIDYYNNGSGLGQRRSFPICEITVSNGTISSIDQVFNGFGYIGSTVFVLPDVKYLIPDGRNEDGTLKNMNMTVQSVLTKAIPSDTGWHYITISTTGTNFDFATNYYTGTELPSGATSYSRFYNTAENLTYNVVSGELTQVPQFILGCYIDHSTSSPYKINSMKQATAFHAVDYSDTEFIAHQATPSDRYVDLTVGASGASYTALGNGWVTAEFTANGGNGWGLVTVAGGVVGQHCFWPTKGGSTRAHIPVRKGQTFSITYGAATLDRVRFTFSEGEV